MQINGKEFLTALFFLFVMQFNGMIEILIFFGFDGVEVRFGGMRLERR